MLSLFARNEGKLLTHRAILSEVWGPAYQVESHYLHVYVSQLRRKIERDPDAAPLHPHRAGGRLPLRRSHWLLSRQQCSERRSAAAGDP